MRKCAACEARQQTIRLLADMIDWHRSQVGLHGQSMAGAAEPPTPRFVAPERKHLPEDEEDVMAMLEAGALSTERADELLAQFQAFNTQVEVQNR